MVLECVISSEKGSALEWCGSCDGLVMELCVGKLMVHIYDVCCSVSVALVLNYIAVVQGGCDMMIPGMLLSLGPSELRK